MPTPLVCNTQPAFDTFATDLASAMKMLPRYISPKYFYDERGSALFDRICELPEYYPTRTEMSILARRADDIAALMGPYAELVEFGAGSLLKVRLLLDAMENPARYLPIDISSEHLLQSVLCLKREYSALEVIPVVADYTRSFALPPVRTRLGRRIGFFPGSTIGNLSPVEAQAFLRRAAHMLRGGALILGADLIKAPRLLHSAYNDTQGVTADFNLNLLVRANRELSTDFRIGQFDHYAFYNASLQRIEMHLLNLRHQVVHLRGKRYELPEGETLHTENSYKFTLRSVRKMASDAGFLPGPVWTDDAGLFSIHWLQAPD